MKPTRAGDAALGIDAPITRRDFLGSALLASGSVLLTGAPPAQLMARNDDFTGYGGVGEYSSSNGNTWDVLEAGHVIRDGRYDPLPEDVIDIRESYDCAVIGGEAAAVVVNGTIAVASQQVFFGDLLQATIVSSATKTTATVKDLTAGHTFTLTRSGAGGAPLQERIGDDAELLGGHQLPVGDFGKIMFTKGAVSGNPLGSVTPRGGVNMQTSKGVLQILTGALSGTAKNSFLTTWKHS